MSNDFCFIVFLCPTCGCFFPVLKWNRYEKDYINFGETEWNKSELLDNTSLCEKCTKGIYLSIFHTTRLPRNFQKSKQWQVQKAEVKIVSEKQTKKYNIFFQMIFIFRSFSGKLMSNFQYRGEQYEKNCEKKGQKIKKDVFICGRLLTPKK